MIFFCAWNAERCFCSPSSSVHAQIAGYVNQPMVDVSILQRSLAILESMVLNSHSLYHRVAQEITVGQLIGHLQVWAHTHAQGRHALCWTKGNGKTNSAPISSSSLSDSLTNPKSSLVVRADFCRSNKKFIRYNFSLAIAGRGFQTR